MKGLYYQLKNIRRDKMCMFSFLLPVIVGLAINLLADVRFYTFEETLFGIVENDLPEETVQWIEKNGAVKVYKHMEDLQKAVLDPTTQMIGVQQERDGIKTFLAGDEFQIYETMGNQLPALFEISGAMNAVSIEVYPSEQEEMFLKSLLVGLTLLTAMFMGCTFNAMNIISEKEEGTALVNAILPTTQRDYVFQKISVGLIGGVVSSIVTASVCMNIGGQQFLVLIVLSVLSSFIAATIGMYIGALSNGVMMGIVFIKFIMIIFIALPILFYYMLPVGSVGRMLSYLLPSSSAFYGIMALMEKGENIGVYLFVLFIHSVVWFCITINRKTKASC